jgi:hypothetical protein
MANWPKESVHSKILAFGARYSDFVHVCCPEGEAAGPRNGRPVWCAQRSEGVFSDPRKN